MYISCDFLFIFLNLKLLFEFFFIVTRVSRPPCPHPSVWFLPSVGKRFLLPTAARGAKRNPVFWRYCAQTWIKTAALQRSGRNENWEFSRTLPPSTSWRGEDANGSCNFFFLCPKTWNAVESVYTWSQFHNVGSRSASWDQSQTVQLK